MPTANTFILYTTNVEKAKSEIQHKRGNVTQLCTRNIIIALLPQAVDPAKLIHAQVSIPNNLDTQSQLFVDAWKLGLVEKPSTVEPWDAEGYLHPRNRFNDDDLAREFELYPPTTSSYMIGSIAVGLVIVSGQEPALAFSENEIENTIAQVMNGLQRLASFEPYANITFAYQTSLLTIDATPPTECPTTTSCEPVWRDPALTQLGVPTGLSGVRAYNEQLIVDTESQWAFMAFFTKYPQGWFAYAGSGRICMEYSNDGWGPAQIYKVFAHETAHIFGAADEYAASNCSCANSGYYNVPNYNCENCDSPFPKRSCLMKENDISNLCSWSRGQLGWPFAVTLSELSNRSPSVVAMNQTLYLAWKGASNDFLNIMSSADGIHWANKVILQEKSGVAPALAALNGRLYLCWKGASNDFLNVMSSADGTH